MSTSSHLPAWNISFYHINISFYSKKVKECFKQRSHFLANLKPPFAHLYFLLAYLYPICILWCIPTLCFPRGSDGVKSACNAGDSGSITGTGRSPEEGNGYPLQCSCIETPRDRGDWRATVHGDTESNKTEWLTLIFLLLLVNILIPDSTLLSLYIIHCNYYQ